MSTKKWRYQLPDFFENLSGSNGRSRRAINRFFSINTINSSIEKKKIETDFITSIALFYGGTIKTEKKNNMIFLPTLLNGYIYCVYIFFSSFF